MIFPFKTSDADVTQKSNETRSQLNTSVSSTTSIGNQLERKISFEEKRSVTSSHKANSLQLNDSVKSTSSAVENHQQKETFNELREEDDSFELEDEDTGRCSVM